MKAIWGFVGILGLVASIMALSSLVYGAFSEPLGPYMQGFMGGLLEIYRTMRDALFAGLGTTFSGLINFTARWLSWLPPAPWAVFSPLERDFVVLYCLGAGAAFRTIRQLMNEKSGGSEAYWLMRVVRDAVFWPVAMAAHLFNWIFAPARVSRSHRGFIHFYFQLFNVFLGGALFLILVFAENGVGL